MSRRLESFVKHEDENLTEIVGVNNGETVGTENDPLIGYQGIHCPLNPSGSYNFHIPQIFT